MSENKKNVPKIRFPGFNDAWEQRKLGDLSNEFRSGEFIKASDISTLGDYPVYGGNGIRGYANTYNHEGEYALIGRQGALCGNMQYSCGKAYFTEHAVAVRANNENDTRFLYYLLDIMNLGQYSGQSAQPGLAVGNLIRLKTMVPIKAEQFKISLLLSKLDNLITLHQRKLNNVKKLKAGMLQKMFPKNGEDFPEVRFPGFTDAWEQRKLMEVVDVCSGRDYKHLSEGKIPVYGTGGYMLSVNEALSFKDDAIGIGRKGTIDNPYILRAPFWTVDTLFYAIPKANNDLNYIYNCFKNVNWKQKDESTGVPSLSKATINNTEIMVTKYEEQIKIGTFFESLDNLITLHQRKLEHLQELKKALLQQMFV